MDEKSFITKKSNDEDDVIEFYDHYAHSWDNRFGLSMSTKHFIEKRWESFERVLGNSKKSDLALELGVGTGIYIDRASKLFSKILAVDGSKKMLIELNKKLDEKKIRNVSTLHSNVLSISEVSNETIDCLYFFGLLEHIVNVDKFVQEIYRVLRKDGIVIGVTPNADSPWYRLRSLVRGTGKHCSSDKYYKKRDIESLFLRYGFYSAEFDYWGAVPAGLKSKNVYKILSFIEDKLRKTRFNNYLGGITFKFKKS
jgi:ubiquinone/menaquinone biosynthesis C-methylase UbiE